MSDTAEDMRALADFQRAEKDERARKNLTALADAGIDFDCNQKGVIRIQAADALVIYYPSTNKWQHRGRMGKGSVDQFISWLKARLP